METTTSRSNWLSLAALLLVLPAAWFFCINILNETGINGPYNASQPILERWGINESLGWNINLLILFGPALALGLSVLQVLCIDWQFTKEQFQFRVTILKKWFPITVALLSGLILATLFTYLLGENCF